MRVMLILAVLVGFILVHIVKLMRLYLIMIDGNIPFDRFVPAYLRTTLINLAIPFKLGEIYRVGVFYRLSGGFVSGFFPVLIDRFFDTLAIVMLLLPYEILISKGVTVPVVLLTAFLLVVVFAYIIYPSAYVFLNRYIITSKTSKRSMTALKILEAVHEWHEYVKKLVSGRYGLLILFSIVAWTIELMVLSGFARITGSSFGVSGFGNYIESIISGSTSQLKSTYTIVSIIVIAVATIISTVVYMIGSRRSKTK